MSPIPALTPDSFPAWARLNGVDLHRVELRRAGDKGLGLFVSETGEGDPGSNTSPPVLRIPRDLILTAEAVEDYAKVDLNFRRLLDAVGHQVGGIPKLFVPRSLLLPLLFPILISGDAN